MIKIKNAIADFLIRLKDRQILAFGIIGAVILSEIIVAAMHYALWGGKISIELVFAGFITPLLDALIILFFIVAIITRLKETTQHLKESMQEKETLLRELYHRTKNNMQVISSLISLQSASVSDSRILQMFDDTKNRIRTMALVHEKLYQSNDLSIVNMKEYLWALANALLESYNQGGGSITLKLEADDIALPIDVIMPCGLIINELISNSLKYAFTGGRKGEMRVAFRQIGDGFMELIYGDDGPGLRTANIKDSKTLGLKLVHNLATQQLGGEIQLMAGRGAEFRIVFKNVEGPHNSGHL